ncbi:MAG: FHA domain-containing protein [Solirubrobacteraceae bacterium]
MLRAGQLRHKLIRRLNAAYADGLLSEQTYAWRLDRLLGGGVIDPVSLVGDLTCRSDRFGRRFATLVASARRLAAGPRGGPPVLLALDWSAEAEELVVGRDPGCDVVLERPSVSREHARLVCRDGCWIVQDLESTNGTSVNDVRVGRCRLAPGDRIQFADQLVTID